MGYGQVVSRAWQITRREKKLWILGLMTSLGLLGFGALLLGSVAEILICLGFWIWAALWVVSVYARGGLIAEVQQMEDEGSTGFRRALRAGRKRSGPLCGIGIFVGLPTLVLFLVSGQLLNMVGIVFFWPEGIKADATAWPYPVGLGCSGLYCCGAIIVIGLKSLTQVYADRVAVLEGLGGRDAFRRGRQMLKTNMGPTLVFWLINLALEGIVVALVLSALVLIDVSEVPIRMLGHANLGPWMGAPLCGGLIVIVLAALIGSVERAFTSAMWTLAYRELTGRGEQAVAALVKPGDLRS